MVGLGEDAHFLKGEDKFAVPALAEKKTHTVLDETHSRADGLMMDSSTRRCQREEDTLMEETHSRPGGLLSEKPMSQGSPF